MFDPGDQHKPSGNTTANPFEETKPHISEYTAKEIATLQARLARRLGPEFISTRPGPGNQKIAYLSAEKAINLANEVFGFNGWSSSIQNIQIDFVDENPQTAKVSLGLSVVVRVTLKDGTFHEDIGYGGIENCKGKAMAFEKSKKEATTDALKRALRNFGNVLGNCIYDKEYVTKVSKVKAGNGKFDVNDLHRHPDFVPKIDDHTKIHVQNNLNVSKPPTLDSGDSFDTFDLDDIDFNDTDLSHPDEVVLPPEVVPSNRHVDDRSGSSSVNTPSKMPQMRPPAVPAITTTSGPNLGQRLSNQNNMPMSNQTRNGELHSSSPGQPSHHFAPDQAQSGGTTGLVGPPAFYSARAAENVDEHNFSALPLDATKFNPHRESPSIRKTAGVDHTKSVPVRRDVRKSEVTIPPNIIDPRGDPNRRLGMPAQSIPNTAARSGLSTSAYRPPTRHGSPAVSMASSNPAAPNAIAVDRALTTAKRPPLGDMSNVQHAVTTTTTDGVDAKRQKLVGQSSEALHINQENMEGSNIS